MSSVLNPFTNLWHVLKKLIILSVILFLKTSLRPLIERRLAQGTSYLGDKASVLWFLLIQDDANGTGD